MPSVAWIPSQTEISSNKTSLRSVADYLSETPDEAFIPKRTLCVSPETLNVLENAEKLLEDTEKQLSRMNCDVFEEFDDNYADTEGFLEDKIYVRNVVASTLAKGYYDPGPIAARDRLRSKFTISETIEDKNVVPLYKKLDAIKRRSMIFDKSTTKSTVASNECMLCSAANDKNNDNCGNAEVNNEITKSNEARTNKSNDNRLNLQKGPSISITGDFSVKTTKIVDIRPDSTGRATNETNIIANNVVTLDVQHGAVDLNEISIDRNPVEQKTSPHPTIIGEETKTIVDRATTVEREKSIASTSKRVDEPVPIVEKYAQKVNSIEDRLTDESFKLRANQAENKTTFWYELDALTNLDESLSDFGLREPPMLAEVDSILERQWNVIRRVQGATENFDRFLTDRLGLAVESIVIPERDGSKITGDGLNEKEEKKKQKCDKLIDLTKEIEALSRAKPLFGVTRATEQLALPINSNRPKIDVGDPSDVDFTDEENSYELVNSDPMASNRVDETRNDKVTEPKCIKNPIDEANGYELTKSTAQVQHDDNRLASQTSVNTETRCTSGVEMIGSAQLSNDNNLDFNDDHERENRQDVIFVGNDKDKKSDRDNETATPSIAVDESRTKTSDDRTNVKSNDTNIQSIGKTSVSQRTDATSTLSEISSNKIHEYVDDLSNSLRLSTLSSSNATTNDSAVKSSINDEKRTNLTTESIIEKRLIEARGNLKNLINSIEENESMIKKDANVAVRKQSDDNDVFRVPKAVNSTLPKNEKTKDDRSNERIVTESSDHPRQTFSTTRSFVALLEENSKTTTETSKRQKLSILKKLDSCAIVPKQQSKRLFTSTVLADVELPGNISSFVRFKGVSESSSSDTHSEGEIRYSGSTSYSAGEVVKIRSNNSKTSSSTSDNF